MNSFTTLLPMLKFLPLPQRLLLSLASLLVLLCCSTDLHAQTSYSLVISNTAVTNIWSSDTTWTPTGVPGVDDTVSVSATSGGSNGSLRLDADATVGTFNYVDAPSGGAGIFDIRSDGSSDRTLTVSTFNANFTNTSAGGIRFSSVATTNGFLTLNIGTMNFATNASSRLFAFGALLDPSSNPILAGVTIGNLNMSNGRLSIGAVRRSTNDALNVTLGNVTMSAGTINLSETGGAFGNTILANSLSGSGGNIRVSGNLPASLVEGTLRLVGSNDTTSSILLSDGGNNRRFNLEYAGTGAQTLARSNTYTGTTTVTSGTLKITDAAGLGSTSTGTTVASGGTLAVEGGITVGAEALTLSGAGAAGSGALRSVSGVNAYDGDITLAADASISADAGTLNLTNAGTITGSGFGLTLGGAGDIVVSRVIGTGSGGLIKDGAGTVTLNAANTYTGATEIFGGVLALGAGASVADSSSVVLGHTGTFDVSALESFAVGEGRAIGGAGTITGNVSLLSGAGLMVLDLNSPLTVTGTVTLDDSFGIADLLGPDGNAFDWTGVAPGTYTLLNNGSDFSNIQNWGVENQYSLGNNRFAYFKDGSLQLEVVPEPGTHALLLLAGAGLGAHLIRRRRA